MEGSYFYIIKKERGFGPFLYIKDDDDHYMFRIKQRNIKNQGLIRLLYVLTSKVP